VTEVKQTVPEGSFYYNCPLHLCILSPYRSISGVAQSTGKGALSDEAYEAKLEREEARLEARELAVEQRRLKREAEMAVRAEAKKQRDAITSQERAKKSRLEKEKHLERNSEKKKKLPGTSLLLDTQPRSALSRPRAKKPEAKPVPKTGYVAIGLVAQGIGVPALILAIKKGAIPGEKLNRQWYVDEVVASKYAAEKDKRLLERSLTSMEKARRIRKENLEKCKATQRYLEN